MTESDGGSAARAAAAAGMTRREMLLRGGALAFAVFAPLGCGNSDRIAVPVGRDGGSTAGFLTADELKTLRALVDRFIPGPPEDSAPGASAAGCPEAIDGLLSAFATDPPRIYAGGPFSDRGGAPVNDFLDFVPLDPYETRAWRLRIEGSRGDPALEFNGPVAGWQEVYRDGLAALAAAGFADMLAPLQDVFLRTARDPAVQALVDVAFPHTLQFMYGAPEYGGNRDLIGWTYTKFDGDTQPRGYTREQVENPDNPGLAELLPPLPVSIPLEELLGLLPLATPDAMHGILARSGASLRAMQDEIAAARSARSKSRGA